MNQVFSGTVVKVRKNDPRTVTVEKITRLRHPKYQKVIELRKKYQVHNENFSLQVGDKVVIKSDKPHSKTKRFLVIEKENKEN